MLYTVYIFSFIPLLVPIWRMKVTLGRHIMKRRWYCTHKPSLVIFAGDLVRALKMWNWLRYSIMEDSASSLRVLATKMNIETSLDYDILTKIQWIQVTLGSKAFALALVHVAPTRVDQLYCQPSWNLPVQNPHSVNVTSGCVIHFRAVKRIDPFVQTVLTYTGLETGARRS